MESTFELPLHISYRHPGWLLPVLAFIHAGSIICIFAVPVPVWQTAVIIMFLIFSFFLYVHKYSTGNNTDHSVILILTVWDEWKLADKDGSRSVTLLPGAFVLPSIVILRIRDGKHVRSFILTQESTNPDLLRRLRVRLIHKK